MTPLTTRIRYKVSFHQYTILWQWHTLIMSIVLRWPIHFYCWNDNVSKEWRELLSTPMVQRPIHTVDTWTGTHFIWLTGIGQARPRMSLLLNSGIAWQGHVRAPSYLQCKTDSFTLFSLSLKFFRSCLQIKNYFKKV